MGTQSDDAAVLRYLLQGAAPRYKREQRRYEDKTIPVTDPDDLDPYDRLMWDEQPSISKGEASRRAIEWAESFNYDEARAWFKVGATYRDFRFCRGLTKLGITPGAAGAELHHRGKPTGLTIYAALITQRITPERVQQMIAAEERRREISSSTEDAG